MKIAIEAQRVYRKKKHGMDMVALELIRHLQLIDQVNEYFILVKQDDDNSVLSESDNFHIINLPSVPYPLWEQYYLPKAISKIRPDILHCTSNTAPLQINVPMVLTLHDILYMQKIDLLKGSLYQRFGNLYRKYLVPKIINRCQKIITVSNFEKREINDFFQLPPDRVHTIYNAYSPYFQIIEDSNKLQAYKAKYDLPDQFILYLGNTHPNKNLGNVLKAIHLLHKTTNSNMSLVMPDIDDGFLRSTLNQIGNSELRKAIHLTGYIPNNELVYLYNLATIFLYPSHYESFGMPILEAMACGVPVITSNRAAMPEIANGTAEIIDPDKPEEIMMAIIKLLSNQALYVQYQEEGIKRAKAFSWNHSAHQVLKLYEQIGN
jgi:glycosyltransferase involved in cell wall biosynthesis